MNNLVDPFASLDDHLIPMEETLKVRDGLGLTREDGSYRQLPRRGHFLSRTFRELQDCVAELARELPAVPPPNPVDLPKRVGIVGCGIIGSAVARGLCLAAAADGMHITVSPRSRHRAEELARDFPTKVPAP